MGLKELLEKTVLRVSTFILAIPITAFYTVVLGSASDDFLAFPSTYVVKMIPVGGGSGVGGNTTGGTTQINEVRLGYFGFCIRIESNNKVACRGTVGKNITEHLDKFSYSTDVDIRGEQAAHDLLEFALMLQTKILPSPMVAAGVLFMISLFAVALVTLVQWKRKKGHVTSNMGIVTQALYRNILIIVSAIAVLLALAATLATTQAANAIEFVSTNKQLNPEPQFSTLKTGKAIVVYQWMIVALSLLFTVGILGAFQDPNKSKLVTKEALITERMTNANANNSMMGGDPSGGGMGMGGMPPMGGMGMGMPGPMM